MPLVLFSPVIYWNWQHDWISFGFQLNQGFAFYDATRFVKLGECLGGQLGVVTPLLFSAFIFYSIKAFPDVFRDDANTVRFLLCLSWPVVIFFGISTAVGDVAEANWPAAAYIAGLILAWMVFRLRYAGRRSQRRFMGAAIGLGLALNLVLHIHLVRPIIPIAPKHDTTRQFHGWRSLGRELNTMIADHPSPRGYFLIANRCTSVAELVYYTGNRYTGIHLFDLEEYTFLKGLDDLRGKDAMIVLYRFSEGQMKKYAPFFETLTVVGSHDGRFRNAVIDDLNATILLGTRFKGIDSDH